MANLDHPTTRLMPLWISRRRQRRSLARLRRNMRRVASLLRSFAADIVRIAAVEAQVKPLFRRLFRPLDHTAIEQRVEHFHVVPVSPGEHDRQRQPASVGQEVALGPALSPVGGVAPGGFRVAISPLFPSGALTMHPSPACQVQLIPSSSSNSWSNSAQAFSKAPASTHSRKRSCTVDFGPNWAGSADHCEPVRPSQISPLRIFRSSLRGRPGFLRTLWMTSSGCSRAHSASSTSQSVGSSFALRGVIRPV